VLGGAELIAVNATPSRPFDVAHCVVLITGGAGSQGAHEARRFVELGARVVIGDVRHQAAADVADELGPAAAAVSLDVSDEEAWVSAVRETERRFGPLTTLVNNAGTSSPAAIVDDTVEAFRRTLDVNLVGAFLGIKHAAPSMERAGGGSIVNISSISGLGGFAGGGAYAASKWALRGLTRVAAADLAPAIRVNAILPGVVDTEMIRAGGMSTEELLERNRSRLLVKRLGRPEDVAALVLFLASERSSYITGADLLVDGGWTTGKVGRVAP
jgi:3alpha(or 20beta)-hydroxysteroid dehydrogenase